MILQIIFVNIFFLQVTGHEVIGNWSPWSAWSGCSQTCYDGVALPNRIRTRTCEPQGCYCHTGNASQSISCNTNINCHGSVDSTISPPTQSLGTAKTDIPTTSSKTTTTPSTSPTVSKILPGTEITQTFTTKTGSTKTVRTTQVIGTITTDIPTTASKTTTTRSSSPTLSTENTQTFTTTTGNTKTVTTTQDIGTITTDIPTTESKKTTTPSSSPTLSTENTQTVTTTTGKTKTVTSTPDIGTTSTDIPSTASQETTTSVSSPTIPEATSISKGTPISTMTTGITETVSTTVCADIMVPKHCNCTAVVAKEVAKVAAKLILDPLIAALKEKWKKKIAELKGCELNKLKGALRELILDKSDLDATIKEWLKGKKQLRKDIDCGNDADKEQRFNLYDMVIIQSNKLQGDSKALGKNIRTLQDKIKECTIKNNRPVWKKVLDFINIFD